MYFGKDAVKIHRPREIPKAISAVTWIVKWTKNLLPTMKLNGNVGGKKNTYRTPVMRSRYLNRQGKI